MQLTVAPCDPASTSASISARLLYCCGDSITISFLGVFPARPCMAISLVCVYSQMDNSVTGLLPLVCESVARVQ